MPMAVAYKSSVSGFLEKVSGMRGRQARVAVGVAQLPAILPSRSKESLRFESNVLANAKYVGTCRFCPV